MKKQKYSIWILNKLNELHRENKIYAICYNNKIYNYPVWDFIEKFNAFKSKNKIKTLTDNSLKPEWICVLYQNYDKRGEYYRFINDCDYEDRKHTWGVTHLVPFLPQE